METQTGSNYPTPKGNKRTTTRISRSKCNAPIEEVPSLSTALMDQVDNNGSNALSFSNNKLTRVSSRLQLNNSHKYIYIIWIVALIVSCILASLSNSNQQETTLPPPIDVVADNQEPISVIPPVHLRPKVKVNIREWSRKLSDEIRAVNNKTSCSNTIRRYFEKHSDNQMIEATKLRDSIINQTVVLLSQHRAAVNAIVAEAEKAVVAHNFVKNLRVNYTDVHRLRNELELNPSTSQQQLDPAAQAIADAAMGSSGASGSGPGSQTPQFTSIGGGTPVPGPPEWQTPVKSIIMQVNKNFGDIPVNTSISAVHLPLPIYPGSPEIMNGIAWTEKLDFVFKRNLNQYAHVHHQYYGDHLGFLRTFPAHKWRIPRTDPDLFDARTRPWYITGASAPKDIVILVDTSGSMTGLRREIAKGVVFEILDTLTNADYFSVLRFSETVTPVGLPKCNNLKTPKMTPELLEQCGEFPTSLLQRQQQQQQQQQPQLHPIQAMPPVLSLEQRERLECQAFRKQRENRHQYLRDHPNIDPAKNGSYMIEEAYQKSIVNVTNDIRDAYLLPATSRNIRYLKSNFTMPTAGIANFTHALMAAFELLQAYNRTTEHSSSDCNQAIMLITDGAIRSHEEVFNRYNYPNSPIRLFSYMIGREVGDVSHTKAMACNNRGYYTHVINLGEIREQVQKYTPVMARPLVLAHHHPITWTYAYGDETHQVLTDWVLEIKRRERARIMLNEERERLNDSNSTDVINIELTNIPEYDELPLVDEELRNRIICEDTNGDDLAAMDQSLHDELDPLGYNELTCHWTTRRADLLTSVVKPVFDNRNTTLIFERILSKNIWTERETHVRNAQLLGVASVDIRINDIIRSSPSHLLGVNGYAILLGPNGFIMHHPDLRALLEDPFDKQSKILKPYFNAVDLSHIEQVYHKNESDPIKKRAEDNRLFKLREAAIKRQTGSESIWIKKAIDCRRRPNIRQQTYYFGPIKDTPYSLMLVLPNNYGSNRMSAVKELNKQSASYLKPSAYDLWTVHPDYKYCESSSNRPNSNSSVALILDVLESLDPNVNNRVSVTFESLTDQLTGRAHIRSNQNHIVCDRDLFPELLFDAAATYEKPDTYCGSFSHLDQECDRHQQSSAFSFYRSQPENKMINDDFCAGSPEEMRSKLVNNQGLEMSFLATRSGLTRVRVFDLSARIKKLADLFIQRHNKAVDESWYSRTVDWNMRFQEDATIVTVPYNAYIRLIAKLRQRITQRHPAPNDTRSNCDPMLDSEPEVPESSPTSSESSTPGVQLASSSSSYESSQPTSAEPTTGIQNDEPAREDASSLKPRSPADPSTAGSGGGPTIDPPPNDRINYNEYSSFDFLDLLANSSVHISATQSAIVNAGSKQRTPVAVTGLLYDYATFARRFLNATSLNIEIMDDDGSRDKHQEFDTVNRHAGLKIDICPNGACPTRCGFRNDTIDCLLVDNNGFIIVGEELPNVGRSLIDYDEKLMASLVDRKVFYKIQMWDYQAICTRSDQLDQKSSTNSGFLTTSGAQHSNKFEIKTIILSLLSNFAASMVWIGSWLLSMIVYQAGIGDLTHQGMEYLSGQPMEWQLGSKFALAQSAIANQSLLALLPNKTYLRPCERLVTLYETRPTETSKLAVIDSPEYYETKCGCSGWYVLDFIPKTNLMMLIVNTTSSCRRACDQAATISNNNVIAPPIPVDLSQPSAGLTIAPNKTAEDQVCAMLERDTQLYTRRPETCYMSHPEESQIHLCGGATRSASVSVALILILMIISAASRSWFTSGIREQDPRESSGFFTRVQ